MVFSVSQKISAEYFSSVTYLKKQRAAVKLPAVYIFLFYFLFFLLKQFLQSLDRNHHSENKKQNCKYQLKGIAGDELP